MIGVEYMGSHTHGYVPGGEKRVCACGCQRVYTATQRNQKYYLEACAYKMRKAKANAKRAKAREALESGLDKLQAEVEDCLSVGELDFNPAILDRLKKEENENQLTTNRAR